MATMTWWSRTSSISPLEEDQWAMGDLTNGRNTLPKELKTCTNIITFKKLLKTFYLKRPTCSSYIHNVHFSFFIHLLVYSSFLYTLHFYLRKYLFFIYVFLWFSLFNIVERYKVIYISLYKCNKLLLLLLRIFYRPPPSTKNKLTTAKFFSEFAKLTEDLKNCHSPLRITGDFNFHFDKNDNADARNFLDFLERQIWLNMMILDIWNSYICTAVKRWDPRS